MFAPEPKSSVTNWRHGHFSGGFPGFGSCPITLYYPVIRAPSNYFALRHWFRSPYESRRPVQNQPVRPLLGPSVQWQEGLEARQMTGRVVERLRAWSAVTDVIPRRIKHEASLPNCWPRVSRQDLAARLYTVQLMTASGWALGRQMAGRWLAPGLRLTGTLAH
jgi:hypothetical protein